MAIPTITRNPTENELAGDDGFTPLVTRRGSFKTPLDQLHAQLAKEHQAAQAKGLPFAWAAAKAELEDAKRSAQLQLRRSGSVGKIPAIDLKKYSDIKNFKLIKEGETHDKDLSKENHLPVSIAWKQYSFKGFEEFKYRICESIESSLERAREKHLPANVKFVEVKKK